jgi:hypothetical protein
MRTPATSAMDLPAWATPPNRQTGHHDWLPLVDRRCLRRRRGSLNDGDFHLVGHIHITPDGV